MTYELPYKLNEMFLEEQCRVNIDEKKWARARALAISKYFERAPFDSELAITEALSTFYKELA